jgi:hypothetical protein
MNRNQSQRDYDSRAPGVFCAIHYSYGDLAPLGEKSNTLETQREGVNRGTQGRGKALSKKSSASSVPLRFNGVALNGDTHAQEKGMLSLIFFCVAR